jgi:molybdopterin converting factor small subunit
VTTGTVTTGTVLVRLFAGARAAAGGTAQTDVAVGDATTVGEALDTLADQHQGLAKVLTACSFLLDEVRATRTSPLRPGQVLDVLPPFSGG